MNNKFDITCGFIALLAIIGVSFFGGMCYNVARYNKIEKMNYEIVKTALTSKDRATHDIVIADKYIISVRRLDGKDITSTDLDEEE